ncbi:hypothetical protein GYMLUDRAFT_90541 [Collybiopsis luxurians FD-317 M1]|nr:hypothetical protein GYMLUDRAFT_90541 [Collybiopsis luxurians FD-317 M1]
MSSPSRPATQRLLYRGALSLPDSDLPLDGLTFSARLDVDRKLLENPLALDLESMRGRPTLRFMGVTNLKDIHMDDSGDITLDIHPAAILSRVYFENIFCLPTTSTDSLGVKIALGDSAGSETTQIIVFLKQILNNDDPKEPSYVLSVARITPRPVIKPRLPRPDDPTPRKPPSAPFGKPPDLRRVASLNASTDLVRKRQKLSNGSAIANLGSDVRLGQKTMPELGIFKVPLLPDKDAKRDKGKGKALSMDDVFSLGDPSGGSGKRKVENKGKRKRESDEGASSQPQEESQQEKENKTRIKQATIRQLEDRYGITKTHPEFKAVYNHTIQGVAFAIRADIKLRPVEEQLIDRLVTVHVGMYTGSAYFYEDPVP